MTHLPADLQKKMEVAAPTDIDWRYRPMFGGIGVYANDRMCVSLSDIGLAIKIAGGEREVLLKLRGAKALQYEPSMPPSKTYVVLPDAMVKDRKALSLWLGVAAAQVAAAPVSKHRSAKRKARGT